MDGADTTCPVCGGNCTGFPHIALPSDYPFLSEAHMAEHPKTDEPEESEKDRPRRVRKRDRRAKRGPVEDRAKHPSEDR